VKSGETAPKERAYVYNCVDRSPLVGPFCRLVVRWFVYWMPPGVPANLLTLTSSACVWAMLAVACLAPMGSAAPWCFALMALYVIYDHADGMHARRTGTSGPLGEYLDHYLDAFHGPLAVAAMFLVAGQQHSALLAAMVGLVLMAAAATMVEQRVTGTLYFGFVGPFEAMMLAVAFLASWCLPGAQAIWSRTIGGGPSCFGAAMAAAAAGCAVTAAGCVRRMGRLPPGLLLYFALNAAMGWAGTRPGSPWWLAPVLLTLHGADYVGRVISGTLRRSPAPLPDIAAPAGAVVAVMAGEFPAWWLAVLSGYLLARNAWSAAVSVAAFRDGWRWWNRAASSGPV
jgi:phosphatidylglycerophosphate synthase